MPKKETFQTCLQAPWTSFRKALRRKLTRQGLEMPHYKMWLNLWGVSRANTSQTGKEKCMPKCMARQSSRHHSNVPFDHGINVWLLQLKLIYTVKLEILNTLQKKNMLPRSRSVLKKNCNLCGCKRKYGHFRRETMLRGTWSCVAHGLVSSFSCTSQALRSKLDMSVNWTNTPTGHKVKLPYQPWDWWRPLCLGSTESIISEPSHL